MGVAESAGQLILMLFPLVMILAGAGDVMTRRIPNSLIIGIAALFLPAALVTGMPLWIMSLHVATAAVLLLFGFGLFSFGVIGGGDAKMMAAAGLWLGFPCSILFVTFSALAGGILAAAIGLWFLVTMEGGMHSAWFDKAVAPLKPSVPYGFALAVGAILATPFSWWMRAAIG
jgi:prepilin peptidase CpaA